MNFATPRPSRRPRENIVPMINVVFLLLIFFLMSAQIAPPDPFEVTLPQSAAEDFNSADLTLYVSAQGDLSFGGKTQAAALAALAQRDTTAPLMMRADAALAALDLTAILQDLRRIGITDVLLLTGAR